MSNTQHKSKGERQKRPEGERLLSPEMYARLMRLAQGPKYANLSREARKAAVERAAAETAQ